QNIDAERSPQFMQYRIDSLRILNERELVNNHYRPRLSWIADAGLIASNPAGAYRNLGVSGGLGFTVPIYDGGQRKLNYQKIEIEELTRTNYASFYRTQYNAHVAELRREMDMNILLLAD